MACLLACALVLPPGVEQGAVRADDGLPPRAPRTVEEIDVAPPANEVATVAPPLDNAQGTASLLAYQSFQDGNWEIYVTVPYAGVPRRLTADPASDLEPKLSPDLSRIVFTSRRTGNYDLFRINVDGTGLVQLTGDGATDSAATWSPDGSRLAFQSRRTGNDDIFIMNADGGGLVQLTNNLDYDGEPAWSPDGKQIAFISRRTPGDHTFFLYVMNADGSGQRVLASSPYSSRPAWSPDAQRLLYDAFDPSAGQRLYIYEVASNSLHPTGHFPVSSYPYVDVMAGAWGASDTVYVTVAEYTPVNGQFYLQRLQVWSVDVTNPASGSPVAFSPAAFPSWGSSDRRPPITTPWFPTPIGKRFAPLEVRVTGGDQGEAGIATVEVQTRRSSNESWQTYGGGCVVAARAVWSCQVPTSDGAQLQVRSRGIDAYGNREAWSNDPQRWATAEIYDKEYMGVVRDLRGIPLANVSMTGFPSTVEPVVLTDGAGNWRAHQRETSQIYSVAAGLPGALTSTIRSDRFDLTGTDRMVRGDFDLIPSDNVLVNPGFDTPGLGWSAMNRSPLAWLDPAVLTIPSGQLRLSSMASYEYLRSPIGGAASVQVGDTTVIAYHNWSETTLRLCQGSQPCVETDPIPGWMTDLGAAADGALAIIARNTSNASQFQLRTQAGTWQAAMAFPYYSEGANHRLLADHDGRWHYVWSDLVGNVYMAHRADGGGWSSADPVGYLPLGMDAVIDSDNLLRIIGCADDGVTDRTWSPWSGLSAPTSIASQVCQKNTLAAQIDLAGNIYAVWTNGGNTVASRRLAGGSWGAPVALDGHAQALRGLVAGNSGRPRLVVSDGAERLLLMEITADGQWSAPLARTLAAPYAGGRLLATDLNAMTLTTSDQYPYASASSLTHYMLIDGSGVAGVRQVVTIPADMRSPTLFMRYQYSSVDPADSLTISIQASDAPTPTVVSMATPFNGIWGTQWLDASAWAGKTVTVTVALADGAGGSMPGAYLDTVALASWTTPAVTAIAPLQLDGEGSTFTITGERFALTPTVLVGGHAAFVTMLDPQHLTVTLPAGTPLGLRSVIVVNPGGFAAQAAETVSVGSDWVTLPILLRWTP